ncbi:MAG: hypothetical protein IAF38_07340 [Bacteroidia bacterium]|nr:hypothetical protein [Bacteroidia bacterium]
MKTVFKLSLASVLILFSSCGRTKDSAEIFFSEVAFEKNGIYYEINSSTNSDYQKYTGTDTCYYQNGKINAVYRINDGLPNGHWEYFDESGKKTSDLHFKEGKLINKMKLY